MSKTIVSELADETEALVTATKDIAGEHVREARHRVELALRRAKRIYGQVCDKAVDGSATVNELVHKNSYPAIAIGLGLGAILGYFTAKGCTSCGLRPRAE
jgi:ElaB/YqjD/DUF883 family membrane-anchored ribosome-binding protein